MKKIIIINMIQYAYQDGGTNFLFLHGSISAVLGKK